MRSTVLLAALAIGCGNGARPATGDAAGDSAGDSGSADAATGSATVTVRDSVHPTVVANAAVVFTDPSGRMTEAYTDAMGQATGILSPGSSVTVRLDDSHLATVVDVMPGDQLTFGNGHFTLSGSLTVSFTAYSDPQAVYRVYTACMSYPVTPPSTTVTLEFCNGSRTDTDVYVVAYSNNAAAATAIVHNVDLTTGAVTVPDAWVPMKTVLSTVTGINDTFSQRFYDVPEDFTGAGNSSAPSTTFTVPADSAIQIIQTDVEQSSTRYQTILDRILPSATSYHLTSGDLRPWITSVTYTPGTRTVSSVAPASLTGDVVMYELIWGTAQSPNYWEIYAPAFEPVTLPGLPADIPDPSTNVNAPSVDVVIFDSSALSGWDSVRPHIYEIATTIPDPANTPDRKYVQAITH